MIVESNQNFPLTSGRAEAMLCQDIVLPHGTWPQKSSKALEESKEQVLQGAADGTGIV